jgi:hypothetical protein
MPADYIASFLVPDNRLYQPECFNGIFYLLVFSVTRCQLFAWVVAGWVQLLEVFCDDSHCKVLLFVCPIRSNIGEMKHRQIILHKGALCGDEKPPLKDYSRLRVKAAMAIRVLYTINDSTGIIDMSMTSF